jgi:iron complex outermembrane receptor protein
MRIQALCLSASALALTWCGVANAQTATPTDATAKSTTVQELVVTGERRNTNLQKTAIAATVLTGNDILKSPVFTVDQLQFLAPSLTVNNFGQGDDFDIRGIGKGEHNSQTATGVVTYRDGVATFPGYFMEEPYFDISGVEVLRGPQGTFSGQNATGGAVIINSANPVINGGYSGYLMGHYGNYNDTGLQGAVNLPISDDLAMRVAFDGEYRDSFYHISGPWTGDPNTLWGSARISLLWTPTPQLKVLFKTDYDYLDNGGYFGSAILGPTGTPNGANNLFNFANNYHTFATDQFVRSSLRVDYTNADGIDFRSVSAVQQGRSAWTGDIDGTASIPPNQVNYSIDEGVDETILSQEFNIISPDRGPFSWILGAYYQHDEHNYPAGFFDIGVPPGGFDENLFGVNITQNEAVFGQVSFNLPDGFQLQVGARYSGWTTWNGGTSYVPEYAIPALNFYYYQSNVSESGQNFTGKVTLNWNLDAHNFLYAFVASGAKPGGLNTPFLYGAGAGTTPEPFGQEYVTDYEVGWKSSLFDNHLRTQLGGYYNSYTGFQVVIPDAGLPTQTTEQNVKNPTILYGFEGSAQAVFGDFSANAAVGLEHSALGNFYTFDPRVTLVAPANCNPNTGPATPTCLNLSGHPQTYAPDVTYDLGAQYNFRLAGGDIITPSISFSYISSQWGTLFDNRSQGDYLGARNILNASIAWTHDGYVATLYGTNLLNDHYVAALLSPVQYAGPPLQFGVSLLKKF